MIVRMLQPSAALSLLLQNASLIPLPQQFGATKDSFIRAGIARRRRG